MSPKFNKMSPRAEYLVLLLSLVTACGDISKFGLHTNKDKGSLFSAAEDSPISGNPADSSPGDIVEAPYTAVTDSGEGQVLTFEGSLITPGETSRGSEDGTCEGAGCSSTAPNGSPTGASHNPAVGSDCEDDQCTTPPSAGGNSGPGSNGGNGTRGSEHTDPNPSAGNRPVPNPDRQVPIATHQFYKDKLNALVDKIVTQNMNTLGAGRSARSKFKTVDLGIINIKSYPFQTPQNSPNGQRLAKARMYRNLVKASIPASHGRVVQRNQLIDAADRSLEKADQSFGSDLPAAEFALRLANLALNTAASSKIEAWGRDIYRSVTGRDPITNKVLSATMQGASLLATVAVIDLEVVTLSSLIVPISVGLVILAAVAGIEKLSPSYNIAEKLVSMGVVNSNITDDQPDSKPTFDFNDPTKPPVGADGKEWAWKGPDGPGGARGGYKNPSNPSQSMHPDLSHPDPIGPHWDFTDRAKGQWRIYPDGTVRSK